jgi:diguanylate cyclase (GGDEF)-like protein/PAS domain S-box-containing protein
MAPEPGPDTISTAAVRRQSSWSRSLGAAQTALVTVALLGLVGFSVWGFTLAQDVLQLRDELGARAGWLEASDGLVERLTLSDPDAVRLVAARGLDLLTEVRARPSVSGRSGALIADLAVTFVDAQKTQSISASIIESMRHGLNELTEVLRIDRVQLSNRLDQHWTEVFLLVIGALALCVGFFSLLLLFLRASGRLGHWRARFALLVRGSRTGLWEWDIAHGTVIYSSRWQVILGLEAGEVSRTIDGWLHRVHPEDLPSVRRSLQAHLAGETSFFDHEHRVRHGSGRYRWFQVCGVAALDADGGATGMAGAFVDISAIREAKTSVRELEFTDRMLSVLDGAMGILSLDQGLLEHSASLPELLTQWRSVDEWWVQVRGTVRLPSPQPCVHCALPALIGRASVSARGPHGTRQVFELTFGGHDHLSGQESGGNVVFIRDVSEATRAAELAALEAATDENNIIDRVTGLPDRRAFLRTLKETMSEAAVEDRYDFAVVCLDVDGLGLVNDTLGSQAGDTLLSTIAQRLKRGLGERDALSRIGGDEFGILLNNLENEKQASALISGLPAAIGAPVDLLGLEVIPTATVGAAIGHAEYQDAESMIREAEAACRSAVKGGKRAVEIVSGPVTKGTRKTLRMNNDLRRALERDEFKLNYQPIIPLKPGLSRGFEALLRWQHPDFGAVGPADFIPLAEATGAIVPIGLWVFREACSRLVRWKEVYPAMAGHLMMSVNLSMRQLRERDLVEQLRTILSETGAAPQEIKLEITESTVMENPAETERILSRLKALGVHLWVDDFGTGYSSLSYLQQFPIDGLKIDRAFVSPVVEGLSSQQIAISIIELGHNLGLKVVAEGVETPEQLAFLETSGCDLAQGRHFGRAVDEHKADAIVRKWSLEFPPDDGVTDTVQEHMGVPPEMLSSDSIS